MAWHEETPIVPADVDRTPLEGFEIGDQVGNPLYTVIDEHFLVGILFLAIPVLAWLAVRLVRWQADRGSERAAAVLRHHDALTIPRRLAFWAVAGSALVHLALVFTHEPSGYTALYLAGAALLGAAAHWLLLGRRTAWAVTVVVGSIAAFWFLGAPPDQVSMATKLLELFALALLAYPVGERRRRFAPSGVVALVVVTGVAAWIGAFGTAGEDGGHHGGEYPEPGTVVPYIEALEATHEQEEAAAELYWSTVAGVERFHDPAVAEAAGYHVGTVRGVDHHAQNPALIGDGRIFDPAYPESLIYAESPAGPVLIGVMFEMDGIGQPGPAIGGPITVWHSHENVCFSLTPPALAGLLNPYGLCPLGSVNIPITGEMIHLWLVPGTEDQWGHIEDEELTAYLAGLAS